MTTRPYFSSRKFSQQWLMLGACFQAASASTECPNTDNPYGSRALIQGSRKMRRRVPDAIETRWQRLRSEMIDEIGIDHFQHYAATAVPATLAYLIESYKNTLALTQSEVHVHLIGSTYLFEGLSNWTWLARALPPDIRKAEVALIMGTPFQEDGVMVEKNGSVITFDVPDAGQLVEPVLSQTTQADDRKPLDEKSLRQKACRTWHYGSKVVSVKCYEHLYQTVASGLPPAHMAVMINPGFPLPWRRSYDGVLQYLLEHDIPSAVSAQLTWDNSISNLLSFPGMAMKPRLDGSDEAFQTLTTLRSYQAKILGVTVSPFPYLYTDPNCTPNDPACEAIAKNAVLQVFKGREEQARPLVMASALPFNSDARSLARTKGLPEAETFELIRALRTNVTTAYQAAMEGWANAMRKPRDEANITG